MMVAIKNRCHACGQPRAEADETCAKCGQPLPPIESEAPASDAVAEPPGGMAWAYRIPILNNRYTWIRWGWAAFWFGIGFALAIGVPLTIAFGSTDSSDVRQMVLLFAGTFIVVVLVVLGMGAWAAIVSGNHVGAVFALEPDGLHVRTHNDGFLGRAEQISLVLGSSFSEARRTAGGFEAMLPGDVTARWAQVRSADFNERTSVITLHRRWHNPARIYVPRERFSEASAYVRSHAERIPGGTIGAGRVPARDHTPSFGEPSKRA